jgi:hypothetical protein
MTTMTILQQKDEPEDALRYGISTIGRLTECYFPHIHPIVRRSLIRPQSTDSPNSRSFFLSLSFAFSDTFGFVMAALRPRIL